ncbi:MAG: CbrC family protein [Lachnospiraceae bacterium]|nr:CbrC family protein [Lachnospiraceae bacterium]
MKPELIEPLSYYDLLMNDDNEVLLALPGYFKGEALTAEVHYQGGRHAVFVRNTDQLILCDEIHPEVRKHILESDEILVYEIDAKREYMAKVVVDDIDALSEEAEELHENHFPFHPFPVNDGTFETGSAVCDFCRSETRIYYRGRTDEDEESVTVCPECIKNGRPGILGISLFPGMKKECREKEGWEEIENSTPPFKSDGEVSTLWGAHCGECGVYLGRFSPEDISEELTEELKKTWDNEFNIYKDEDPEEILKSFRADYISDALHLFRCSSCKKVFGIFV